MDVKNELRHLLAAAKQSHWQDRLESEIGFLEQLVAGDEARSAEEALRAAAGRAAKRIEEEGAVTQAGVLDFEKELEGLRPACKAYELVCAGHAHIDMNWMWGFHETVSVTIDTFRTILDLLDRYPQFRFSQSQAAVYRIIERYAPHLVEPIRGKIASGQWEVTASQWVESDMNLPSGESLARQMLYARRYLLDCYGVPEEAFELVFLPDTFGHSANTPELLAAAGVRFLYHCRGAVGPHVSRWEAPSGRSVTVYREPRWYNTDVSGSVAAFLPQFAREAGLKRALCLYGVGDHGGGPTVRDIERLTDMSEWPLYPTITFDSLRSYFERLSEAELPVSRGERNMIFTGCYSSQSRIKAANRKAEELLYEAELATSLATLHRGTRDGDELVRANVKEAWTKALFSNFHDILPGSGVELTRQFAMGSFQETAAAALSALSEAQRRLSGTGTPTADAAGGSSRSEGGGVGYGLERFDPPAAERGAGVDRLYHLYNSLQWDREAAADLTVWDWPGDPRAIECSDESGRVIGHDLLESGTNEYWGHTFVHLRLRLAVPAFGYAAVRVRERKEPAAAGVFFPWGTERWLVERPVETRLENERVRAVFEPTSMTLVSLFDKSSGVELIGGGPGEGEPGAARPGGLFRLVEEEAGSMTAWIVGRYQSVRDLGNVTRIVESRMGRSLPVQSITYELAVAGGADRSGSSMTVRVSLERETGRLRYEVDCRWLEIGVPGGRMPQLQYRLRPSAVERTLRCDMPFGTIDREPAALDVPANSFAALLPDGGRTPVLQITTDSRQAFRFDENALSVTLLRSSVDPDPFPELGRHRFSFTVSVLAPPAAGDRVASLREALEVRYPLRSLSVAKMAQDAERTASRRPSLLAVEGAGCIVAAVKVPEPSRWSPAPGGKPAGAGRLIVRLYEAGGRPAEVRLGVPGRAVSAARLLDLHERPAAGLEATLEEGRALVSVPPFQIVTVELAVREPTNPERKG